ncbi:MAG: DNA translocase FtsK 4TM domain-containing protein, partial [Candidatus Bruticola sp.]
MSTEQTKRAAAAKLAKAADPASAKKADKTGIKFSRGMSRNERANHTYMWGVVWLFCVTPLLILCLVAPQFTGAAGVAVSYGLHACIGMAVWVLPMISFAAAVHCFEFEVEKRIRNKIIIPMLLIFAPFFAARCASQGGAIGNFIDGLFVSAVGKAGAWMVAVLGMFSILAFMWNVTAEEAVEGCKALSQFSNSTLAVFCRSAVKVLSQLWTWCVSFSKRTAESLIGAKNKFLDQKRHDEEEKERYEAAKKEEMQRRALMYEESGAMSAVSEDIPSKPLTCRTFFEESSDSCGADKSEEEHNISELPQAVANLRSEIEYTQRVAKEQLINEIEKHNSLSEEIIAASRKRRTESAEFAEMGERHVPIRDSVRENYRSESERSKNSLGTQRQVELRPSVKNTSNRERPPLSKRLTGVPYSGHRTETKKPENRGDYADLKVPTYVNRAGTGNGSAGSSLRNGQADDSVKYDRDKLYSKRSVTNNPRTASESKSYSDYVSRKKTKNYAEPDDKIEDLPLRPVRSSSSSENYKSPSVSSAVTADNREKTVSKRQVTGQPVVARTTDDTVEVPLIMPAVQSRPVGQEVAEKTPTDELDEKVKALKFADKIDSDIALGAYPSESGREEKTKINSSASAAGALGYTKAAASTSAGSMQKLNSLSPEERRKALGLG